MIAVLALLTALQTPPETPPTPSPGPIATQAPASAEDPAVTRTAQRELAAWQSGKVDWSHYVKPLGSAMVKQVQAFLSTLGTVRSATFVQQLQRPAGTPLSVYRLDGTKATGYMILGLGNADKIDLIYFKPALGK